MYVPLPQSHFSRSNVRGQQIKQSFLARARALQIDMEDEAEEPMCCKCGDRASHFPLVASERLTILQFSWRTTASLWHVATRSAKVRISARTWDAG